MKYNEIIITEATEKQKKSLGKTLAFRVNYTGDTNDEMGHWISSGNLMDVYYCDGFLVGCSPFNQRPIMVVGNKIPDMINRLKESTKCDNIKII